MQPIPLQYIKTWILQHKHSFQYHCIAMTDIRNKVISLTETTFHLLLQILKNPAPAMKYLQQEISLVTKACK